MNFNDFFQSGKAGELIDQGDNTYGGKFVINPSGGLISKGHPLGATGMFFSCCFLSSKFYFLINSVLGEVSIYETIVITCVPHNSGFG